MGGRKRRGQPALPAAPAVITSAIGTARGVGTASAVGTITALPPGSRLELRLRFDRRGRRKGTTGPYRKDDDAHKLMEQIAHDLGEQRPYTLARMAVDTGRVPLKDKNRDSVIRRLAVGYSKKSTED